MTPLGSMGAFVITGLLTVANAGILVACSSNLVERYLARDQEQFEEAAKGAACAAVAVLVGVMIMADLMP